jgi:pimeloyl-ACP methyl ester carboxylesterase
MPQRHVNDINLYYEIHGRGQPLVLILGLASEVTDTEWLVTALAEHYRVLVLDNRGAGRSDKPDKPYSIELMADDTAQLMQAAGFDRARVIGISMGSRIALELALKHPSMVSQLVLVSACARVVRNWHHYLLFDVVNRLPFFRGKQPRYAFNRQRAASAGYDCTDRLPEIKLPVTIMNGRRDHLAAYPLALELQHGIKHSVLLSFRGGHMFFMWRERQPFLEQLQACLR